MSPCSVTFRHHLSAGVPYERALAAAGHPVVPAGAEAYLIDLDLPHNWPEIDAQLAAGAKVFVYPHGVGVMHYYDGIQPPHPQTKGLFVIAEGFAEVYRLIGYPHPIHVIGWPHCEILPFRPSAAPRRVLFAPIHPLENGHLSEWQRGLNRDAFTALLAVPGIELTVRHLDSLERNGIWEAPGVRYVLGRPDNSYDDIDGADVVVTNGTYAHLSVARGAPTVMIGRDVHPSNGEHPGERRYAERWAQWRDLVRYPWDLLADGDPAEILRAAAAAEGPVTDWKRRFIGEPLRPERFSAQLDEALAIARLDDTRSRVTVAAVAEVLAHPELLRGYAAANGPDDDATLLLRAPGQDTSEAALALLDLFGRLGIDEDRLPDMLLSTDAATPGLDRAIADLASAVLTVRPDAPALAV